MDLRLEPIYMYKANFLININTLIFIEILYAYVCVSGFWICVYVCMCVHMYLLCIYIGVM